MLNRYITRSAQLRADALQLPEVDQPAVLAALETGDCWGEVTKASIAACKTEQARTFLEDWITREYHLEEAAAGME